MVSQWYPESILAFVWLVAGRRIKVMGSLEKELLFCDTFAHDEAEVSWHENVRAAAGRVATAVYRWSAVSFEY